MALVDVSFGLIPILLIFIGFVVWSVFDKKRKQRVKAAQEWVDMFDKTLEQLKEQNERRLK